MNKTPGLKKLLYNDLNTHSKMKLFSLLHFEIILGQNNTNVVVYLNMLQLSIE